MYAAVYGHLGLVKYLLDEVVAINVRNIYDETDLDIEKLFLEYGADNKVD